MICLHNIACTKCDQNKMILFMYKLTTTEQKYIVAHTILELLVLENKK